MKTAFTLKKIHFVPCAPRRQMIKRGMACRAIKKPADIFRFAERMNSILNFTRREILEEISLWKPIHPSIERIASTHE